MKSMGVFAVQRLPLAVSPFHFGPHFCLALLTVMWAVTKAPGGKGLEKVPLRRCLSFLGPISPISPWFPRHSPEGSQSLRFSFHFPFCVLFFCSDWCVFLMPWSSFGCPGLSLLSFLKNTFHFSNQLWDRLCVRKLRLNVSPRPSMGNPREFLIMCNHKHLVHGWGG